MSGDRIFMRLPESATPSDDIEFLPAGAHQLSSPDEGQYNEPQGQFGDRVAGIRIELLKEVRQFTLGDCGTVHHLAGFQVPFHVRPRVVGRPVGLDGISENRTDSL